MHTITLRVTRPMIWLNCNKMGTFWKDYKFKAQREQCEKIRKLQDTEYAEDADATRNKNTTDDEC